jgi:hypothetical protein
LGPHQFWQAVHGRRAGPQEGSFPVALTLYLIMRGVAVEVGIDEVEPVN